MPLYEYECEACGSRFEKIQKYSDPPPDVCAKCGKGPVRKLPSSPAIQFKGSGFYITDYARKSSPSDSSSKSTSGDSSSDTKKSESSDTKKSESAPASTTTSSEKKD